MDLIKDTIISGGADSYKAINYSSYASSGVLVTKSKTSLLNYPTPSSFNDEKYDLNLKCGDIDPIKEESKESKEVYTSLKSNLTHNSKNLPFSETTY